MLLIASAVQMVEQSITFHCQVKMIGNNNIQANFDISNSKGMGKTLPVVRSSRLQIMTSREFMYMNKNVFTVVSILFRAFVKSALLQNVCMFVIRCVLPALFYPQISGLDYGWLSTTNKTLDHFLNGILARKRHFRGEFSAH